MTRLSWTTKQSWQAHVPTSVWDAMSADDREQYLAELESDGYDDVELTDRTITDEAKGF